MLHWTSNTIINPSLRVHIHPTGARFLHRGVQASIQLPRLHYSSSIPWRSAKGKLLWHFSYHMLGNTDAFSFPSVLLKLCFPFYSLLGKGTQSTPHWEKGGVTLKGIQTPAFKLFIERVIFKWFLLVEIWAMGGPVGSTPLDMLRSENKRSSMWNCWPDSGCI